MDLKNLTYPSVICNTKNNVKRANFKFTVKRFPIYGGSFGACGEYFFLDNRCSLNNLCHEEKLVLKNGRTSDFEIDSKLKCSLNINPNVCDTKFSNYITALCQFPILDANDDVNSFGVSETTHVEGPLTTSEVFHSKLDNKPNKHESNVIEVKDFCLEVVKEMVNYLYSEESPRIDEIASEMLEIAEKYQLERLRMIATESLLRSLNVENVFEYLEKSEIYFAEILKEFCIRYIYLNVEEVVRGEK
uniref:Speckle-type POZ protein (inferred by orthology to a human protein) n=1 Tax=Strongyloides venezuelensis TaxID=75913 RepID=A0A0K0FZJ1_STRVS